MFKKVLNKINDLIGLVYDFLYNKYIYSKENIILREEKKIIKEGRKGRRRKGKLRSLPFLFLIFIE